MLNYEIKFITCDEALHLKQGELKVYKYETKKRVEETVYESGKRNYCERRGGHWRSPQTRQIRRLEAKLKDRTVIACNWTSESLITIVFTSGVIAYLTIKPDTLDVTQVLFDKYCVGKLAGQSVTSVVLSNTHLLFIHMDRIATLITFGKKVVNLPCRITDRDPHIQMLELGGPSRRGERKVSWRDNGGSGTICVLIWGASVEPAPWSPAIEDRANLHLYQITGQQIRLAAYHQLENETLLVELSSSNDIIHIVEQSICHKNGVNLEWVRYSMGLSDIGESGRAVCLTGARTGSTRVQLPAPARVLTRPADNDSRLLAACIDGSLLLIHRDSGLTHSTKAGFIATDVMWAGDLVVAFEESGRLQCFDRALSLLHQHSKCHDLTTYLHESRRMQLLLTRTVRGGQLVLAVFAGGPLTLLKIKHPRLLTAWVRWGRVSNAVRLLRAMDWDSEGAQCLWAVNALVVGALRRPLRPPVAGGGEGCEAAAQAALGAFLAPQSPLPPGAHKYAPPVHDLARKFFHHLLRRGRTEKALSLGVDLRAWDLFSDARCAALRERRPSLAAEAAALAQHYAHLPNQNAFTESECSGTCSQCSSRSYSDSEDETSVGSELMRTKPPPLPRVPLQPSLLPVPLSHPEPVSTNSIRPNLHQYLERDNTIWNTELKQHNESGLPPSIKWHSVENVLGAKGSLKYSSLVSINDNRSLVEVIPKPQNDRVTASHFKNLFQTELREESSDTLYRYNYSVGDRTYKCNLERNRPTEKNKVKFSDTVTIAVVSETPPGVPQPLRELADSLPLCPPHKYLSAFAPLPPAPAPAPPPAEHAAPKPPPKIKVVHFGMV